MRKGCVTPWFVFGFIQTNSPVPSQQAYGACLGWLYLNCIITILVALSPLTYGIDLERPLVLKISGMIRSKASVPEDIQPSMPFKDYVHHKLNCGCSIYL